jgi:DegV family protein with EDD domain
MVLEAARMIEAGEELPAIFARLEHIRGQSQLHLTPATLKYLQMSGRVGKLQGALASLLQVKPIIALRDGVLEAQENVRTRGKAIDRLLELTETAVGRSTPIKLGVIHARAPDEGQALLERVQDRLNCQEVMIADLAASLAVHGGPGVLGLAGYPI